MPFGGLLSLGAGLVGIGGSLGGLFGGTPADKVQGYSNYFRPQADIGAFTGTQNLANYNIGAGYIPQYQGTVQNLVNNPYAPGYQASANQIGGAGQFAGGALTGAGLSQLPDIQALINLGFDPQQALYSRLQNQNQQQNLALLGQSGVASTPYGQGVATQANTNFNIDWQNAQLARALQSLQGAGGALGAVGGATTTGLNQATAGAALPYSTYSGINQDALAALTGGAGFGQQISQIPQQQISDYLQYLQQATGQQQANVQQAQAQFGEQQQLGSQLGSSLAGLAKGFGGGGPGGWFGSASKSPFNITGSLY